MSEVPFPFTSPEEADAFKARSLQAMWSHHNAALAKRDGAEFIKDFRSDCLFINNPLGGHGQGTFMGPAGVESWCSQFFDLFSEIHQFKVPLGAHLHESAPGCGVVMISWQIQNDKFSVTGGVDTFIVEAGQFKIVTVVYDVKPA
ncbi:MAG: hypothetical protein NTZ53_13490 [Cyanobacteria bacterium]|nr:hypothetical protein [Cyanobacteriota bacterium]